MLEFNERTNVGQGRDSGAKRETTHTHRIGPGRTRTQDALQLLGGYVLRARAGSEQAFAVRARRPSKWSFRITR